MSQTIFSTSEQIRKTLYALGTLDQHQREVVADALIKKLGDGKVTAEEIKSVVHELRRDGKISEIDREKLLNMIDTE